MDRVSTPVNSAQLHYFFYRMPPKKRNPLTAKERQQRWRDKQKCDSESHSKYLENERERYRSRKEAGTRKGIEEMTQREQRRKWRSEQKEHRKRVKAASTLVTPPVSPDPDVRGRVKQRSANSVVGRKRVRRDRAKAYRTVEKLTVKLATAERRRRRVQISAMNERRNTSKAACLTHLAQRRNDLCATGT